MIKNIKEILREIAMEDHLTIPSVRMLSTGFARLDEIIGLKALNGGNLFCIATMPGIGKSTFMLDLLLNFAISSGREILYITNEKTEQQVTRCLIQKLNDVDINPEQVHYDSGALNSISSAISVLSQLNVSILSYCKSCESVEKALSVTSKPAAVLIDGFEAISEDFEKDFMMIRNLCKNLNIPIIISMWTDKMQENHFRPTLSDVYSIVLKFADSVWLLHRDNYFDTEKRQDNSIPDTELTICKNKNGDIGTIRFGFDGKTKSFIE